MIDEQTAELQHIVCYRLTLIHLTFHGFSYLLQLCPDLTPAGVFLYKNPQN